MPTYTLENENATASRTDNAVVCDASGSTTLAPDWHPLNHIDEFILACGWTHEPEGFVPPEHWQEGIAIRNGGGRHWKREWAAVFCIRYHERHGLSWSN